MRRENSRSPYFFRLQTELGERRKIKRKQASENKMLRQSFCTNKYKMTEKQIIMQQQEAPYIYIYMHMDIYT